MADIAVSDYVVVSVDDGIGVFRLNRPDRGRERHTNQLQRIALVVRVVEPPIVFRRRRDGELAAKRDASTRKAGRFVGPVLGEGGCRRPQNQQESRQEAVHGVLTTVIRPRGIRTELGL